jgi:protein-S-isoprenylcysteine O-methyltransferase Ste14
MYLALFIALASWTLLYQNAELLLYGLAVAVLVYLFVTRFEEPRLQRDFGRAFETYAASVPRWIPRFRRSRYHG